MHFDHVFVIHNLKQKLKHINCYYVYSCRENITFQEQVIKIVVIIRNYVEKCLLLYV